MGGIRSIAVLFHERDRHALTAWYRVWAMAPHWRERGITVEPVWGIGRSIEADLLIPHVDLSYIPDDYWAVIQKHPNVVNRHVRDIRKTVISENLVRRGDAWTGSVIVKTNNNGRGWMEHVLLGRASPKTGPIAWLQQLASSAWIERKRLGRIRYPARYYIFDRAADVPNGVWSNPALVVERFLPEREGEKYVMHTYSFFGDREQGRTFRGDDPWVKALNSAMGEPTRPPEAIVAARHRLKLDFAKIDYVLHEGAAVLLDVNRTPGMGGPIDARRIERSAELARGLDYFQRV